MCPQDKNFAGSHKSGDGPDKESLEEFEEMMKRWGVELPKEEEKAEPLGIDILTGEWCKEKFRQPSDAIKALKEEEKHIEASAALFGYCYTILAPSFFGLTLEQCLEWELKYSQDNQDNVNVCRNLISFENDFSSEQVLYPEGRDNRALKSYVDVLLAAAHALLAFSGETKREYDPHLHETLESAYEIVKPGRVREAENFSNLDFYNDGRHLSGDVVGFLACLGCAVVCYSLAQILSKLRPDYDRDYETAFKAYVQGAKYMLKTGYQINFFDELFAEEEYYKNMNESNIEDVYWNIIDVWEQLKKNSERVQSWQELRGCLLELENIMYEEEHDADIGLYPVNEPGFVYLPRQLSFCDGKLSQKEIHQLIEQQKKEQQEKRLRNDFFEGLWQYLEDKTKDCVVEAEHKWYDNPTKESRINTFMDYSKALEIELHAIIFQNPEVERCVRRILRKRDKDKAYRILMDVKSLGADSLYLSDMSKLLQYVRENRTNNIRPDVTPIEDAISGLPIPEDVERKRGLKTFLIQKEFTDDLSYIYGIRNFSAHRLPEKDVLSRIYNLRKRILGIGCEGYLIKLAEIRKHMDASRRDND